MYVKPNLCGLPNMVITMFNGLKLVHFGIDVFVDNLFSRPYFENLSFTKIEPFEGWLKIFNNYSKAIKSLHSPTEFFI